MPAGPPLDALTAFLVKNLGEDAAKAWLRWLTVEHPDWARQGWERLDVARAKVECAPS